MLYGRKTMTDLGKILKHRDINTDSKGKYCQNNVFPVAASDCKSWTIQKAVERKMDAFQL